MHNASPGLKLQPIRSAAQQRKRVGLLSKSCPTHGAKCIGISFSNRSLQNYLNQ